MAKKDVAAKPGKEKTSKPKKSEVKPESTKTPDTTENYNADKHYKGW